MNYESPSCVKLYHPRGPLVTLAVPADPKAAFTHVALCLDAGFLARAPGLEEGEQRENVGFILRGECGNDDGSLTPYLLLYAAEEPNRFSFLKVYLNKPADVAAFEFAVKMKLSDFPEYAGNDKPERGKSAKTDRYIVAVKKPFGVVFKNNPKHNENARALAQERGEVYKVPVRVFVRWVDQMPVQSVQQPNGSNGTNGTTHSRSAPLNGKPAQHQTGPKQPQAQQPDLAARYAQCLKGIVNSHTIANYREWVNYAKKFEFSDEQREDLERAGNDTLERLGEGVLQGAEPPF